MPRKPSIEAVVADIVERARARDQVAMAIIVRTRENAQRGNARARHSCKLMAQYIKTHPVTEFGVCDVTHSEPMLRMWGLATVEPAEAAETVLQDAPELSFWQVVVAVCNAPVQLVDFVREKVPDGWQRKSFDAGLSNDRCDKTVRLDCWKLGRMFRIASRMKRLADISVPIAAYCPVTAWELGE